jgi:hypothetical protein
MSNTRGKGIETSLKQCNILMQSEVGKVVESQRALEKQLELVEMHQAEVSIDETKCSLHCIHVVR